MRVSKTALIFAIAIIVIAFQAAPGPFVLCRARCTDTRTGEVIEMTCVGGPTVGGTAGCMSECEGVCPSEQTPPEQVESGCCMVEDECPVADACGTDDENDCCPIGSDQCPLGMGKCWICIPNLILAELIPTPHQYQNAHTILSSRLTSRLQTDDAFRRSTHSHTPTEPILAESGMDICVRVCSFLI